MTKPSHAEAARTLAAQTADAALSTLSVRSGGAPFGSRVLFALHDGAPILLISRLAAHTQNLLADPRCSLLIAPPSDQPVATGRATLLGAAAVTDAPAARAAFLAAHPDAARYAGFGDFSFWSIDVAEARYVGGFGQMSWIPGDAWRAAAPDPIAPAAAGIIAHMNDDHADAMVLYCRALAGIEGVESATMTGVDRHGFALRAQTADGARAVRLAFPAPVRNSAGVRKALVAMVQDARKKLG